MEQPESNPTFCTNNCGFYGSSQFEGMCSKCYREHVSRSLNAERNNSFNSYYASSNSSSSVPSSQTALTSTSNADVSPAPNHDDQDDVLGRMDEDNLLPTTVTKINDDLDDDNIDDQNSESPSAMEQTTKPEKQTDLSTATPSVEHTSLLTRVVSAPTMPITISRNIDIPIKNDSTISFSVMETGSLGADSMSPLTASSVDKKKRNRCSWETCNKKLGLTGFDCRCGGQFCPLHRYANEHNCTFDYKEHGQNEIRKNMPVVQADRVRRI